MKLEQLISEAEQQLSRVEVCDKRIEEITALEAKLKSEAETAASFDVLNPEHVDAAARRETQLKHLPKALDAAREGKQQVVEDLLPPIAAIKAELQRMGQQEIVQMRDKIEKMLLPFAPPFNDPRMGVVRLALSLALQTPIVAIIDLNARPKTNVERSSTPEHFAQTAIGHAREVLQIARWHLDNKSFVPPGFADRKIVTRNGVETVV